MFKEPINSTALTTTAANSYFENIRYSGAFFANDVSFLSTVRALYARRIPEGESVTLDYVAKTVTDSELEGRSKGEIFERVCPMTPEGHLVIVSISGQKEAIRKSLEVVSESFASVKGWVEQPAIRALFQKQFPVFMFYNTEQKCSVIYMENMSLKRLHYVQSASMAFLPWYLKIPEDLTQDDRDLGYALRKDSPDDYLALISRIASGFDFEIAYMKKCLADFERGNERRRVNVLEREIGNYNDRIEAMMRDIASYLQELEQRNNELTGIQLKLADDTESELLGYFIRNSNLVFEKVEGSVLTFGVKGYMSYFNEDIVRRNAKRICEANQSGAISARDMEKLLRAVFVDQSLKLRCCGAFTLDLNGYVDALSHYQYSEKYTGYMPNTHLENHSCLGNYHSAIVKFLQRHDYVGAIGQCEASTRSLNFADGIVIRGFMNYLYRDDSYVRCIELPDGSVVKPSEAIRWIKEQEEAAKVEKKEEKEEGTHE